MVLRLILNIPVDCVKKFSRFNITLWPEIWNLIFFFVCTGANNSARVNVNTVIIEKH